MVELTTLHNVGGISTKNVVPLLISFHSVLLRSLNNGGIEAILTQVTDKDATVFDS